jgi:predicted RNA-binding Zn-ribbon protein involved in translation (DUF1610 family)
VPASPSTRYALICDKCFAHNGLLKENMWEDARESFSINAYFYERPTSIFVEYLCPKCGHFNQSARSKRQRLLSSPSGSVNASPDAALPRASPERQQPIVASPSPKPPTSDLPTVDSDESMSMVVDSEQSESPRAS